MPTLFIVFSSQKRKASWCFLGFASFLWANRKQVGGATDVYMLILMLFRALIAQFVNVDTFLVDRRV